MSPSSTPSSSTHMVTRCPKCSTAFRITNAQLALANGAVRCGSCLHIFKATEYLVKPNASETAKKTIPSNAETTLLKTENSAHKNIETKAVNFDKSKALADEEDELISDDMDKPTTAPGSHYEFDGFLDMNAQPKQTISLFEREIKFEPDESFEQDDDDESWAENLLDDDEPTRPLMKKPASAGEPSKADISASETTPSTTSSTTDTPVVSGITFSLIEETNTPESIQTNSLASQTAQVASKADSFSHKLDSELTEAAEPHFSEEFLQATQHMSSPVKKESTETDFAAELFAEPDQPTEQESTPTKAKKPIKSAYKTGGFSVSRAALLMNIIPAPLEFTTRGGKKRLKQKLWTALATVTGLLLLFQIAYFKFDYFGRIEPYRSGYALICPMLNCKVPNLIDKSKIIIYDSHSRSHPHSKDALLFEFIMRNDASFEQPFPDVLLSFSTVNDTPVAARLFKPREYLGGELAGREFIPPKTPVHIEIELKDPGSDAVNYEVTIK